MESIKQGEIWSVDFNPQIGSEIAKVRPALVISNDLINENSSIHLIVPLTSWQDKFKQRVWIIKVKKDENNGLKNDSAINCLQIKSFSNERFIKKIGQIDLVFIDEIKSIVSEMLDTKFN